MKVSFSYLGRQFADVDAYLADVKTEKPAFNQAYAEFFAKDAPARSAIGVEFPDTATRVEIELVAYIPER